MLLWRISSFADLKGNGGKLFSARWHTKGRPVVYLADSVASALLEQLVHLDPSEVPDTFQLLSVNLDGLGVEDCNPPVFWKKDVFITRELGDEWLAEGRSALLRVPSAIVPKTLNYLLNPLHADASRAAILGAERFAIDPRLISAKR